MSEREFDVILFGATGFTGRLVAEYLARHPAAGRWAIAGRNRGKLEALGFDVPIVVADAHDPAAMDDVARRARVVCTTVGPFAKYGSELVRAAADNGTHYCDLTAEVPWMRKMIDRHDARARATGARIVHAAGFDSVPSDLGTFLAQDAMVRRFGRPAERVTAYYGEQSGGVSGGTIASALSLAELASNDREARRLMGNPYALDPDLSVRRAPSPDEKKIGWDRGLGVFTMPFVMAASNTRIVRRSHALLGYPWGPDFVYREVMTMPGNAKGLLFAAGLTVGLMGFLAAASNDRLREILRKKLPQPGEGPSLEARTKGYWKLKIVAQSGADRLVYRASDAADPGYASTARMLAETALCLAHDPLTSPGGFLTPASAMGHALAERLRRVGFVFAEA